MRECLRNWRNDGHSYRRISPSRPAAVVLFDLSTGIRDRYWWTIDGIPTLLRFARLEDAIRDVELELFRRETKPLRAARPVRRKRRQQPEGPARWPLGF